MRPPISEETRHKMRLAHKGKVFSEAHRFALSQVRKGCVFSEETKQKMSERMKRQPASEKCILAMIKANTGRKCSEETKEKIRKALLGRKRSPDVCAKVSAAHKVSEKARLHRIELH